MPARTNDFQRIVLAIESALASQDASVQESGELTDRAGAKREVDILITQDLGHRKLITGVECRGGTRPADIEWIDRMWGKHQELPTDKLVLVSKAGFTKRAKTKAGSLNIDILTVSEAVVLDWDRRLRSATVSMFTLPTLKHLQVLLRPRDGTVEPPPSVPELSLIEPGGRNAGRLIDIVKRTLLLPEVIAALEEQAFPNSGTDVDFDFPFLPGTRLALDDGRTYEPTRISAKAFCQKHVVAVSLDEASYGSTPLAIGSTSVAGHVVRLVQVPGGPTGARLRLSFERPVRAKTARRGRSRRKKR